MGKPRIIVEYIGEEEEFNAVDITAMLLTKMKNVAQDKLCHSIHNAVISVPGSFNHLQRQETWKAASKAGFTGIRMIH